MYIRYVLPLKLHAECYGIVNKPVLYVLPADGRLGWPKNLQVYKIANTAFHSWVHTRIACHWYWLHVRGLCLAWLAGMRVRTIKTCFGPFFGVVQHQQTPYPPHITTCLASPTSSLTISINSLVMFLWARCCMIVIQPHLVLT